MKKLLLLAVVAMIGIGTAFATPVGVNTAKSLGQKFVEANFEMKSGSALELCYTVASDNSVPCVYVFNVGDHGFVIVAASDNVHPILGYSEEGNFDASNPYNGAMFMLETYKNSISYAIEKNIVPTPEIASEWVSLENCGKLSSKKGEEVGPLVWTKWNQNSPYNLYAPSLPANANPSHVAQAPGGRCYAGCVATAIGQLMRYWEHPVTGTGSHGYNCVGYSPTYYQYGYQYANFGATTYQWDLMPRSLSGASQEQIEAVATLLYHCGVAVDMTYDWDGSGSYSDIVPGAMSSYFDYGSCVKKNRNSYTLANWIAMLKNEFNLGRPVYYHGQSSSGGHAFVCDGYDEDDLMHFNFGWSGSDDGWYQVDAIDYASQSGAIINFVPTYIYNNTAQAPTNLVVTKTNNYAQEATITWTNPTKTMNNMNLPSIDRIVLMRDDEVVYSIDNPTPGQSMSYVDSNIPCYSTFKFKVFAVYNAVNGASVTASESFGPTCDWKIIGTSSNMAGWKSGYIIAYDGAGREIDRFTMTSSNPVNYTMPITLGRVSFAWRAGSDDVNLTLKIKDPAGTIVYQYSGHSDSIPSGVLYYGNSGCGEPITEVPTGLVATSDGENIVLTWDEGSRDILGYNVYRDELLCALVHENQFVDQAPEVGGHCYRICYLGDGGESEMSNETCGNVGENCNPPYNLGYYMNTNGAKPRPVVTWEFNDSIGEYPVSYFRVYRKVNEDGEYKKVKDVAKNKREWKDTGTLIHETQYYYKVVAYYYDADSEFECFSAPALSMYDDNEYFVMVVYDEFLDVNESVASNVILYPNPTNGSFTIEAEDIQHVTVYNTVGQLVYSQDCEGNSAVIRLGDMGTGLYMVKVVTSNGESVKKVSVIR